MKQMPALPAFYAQKVAKSNNKHEMCLPKKQMWHLINNID